MTYVKQMLKTVVCSLSFPALKIKDIRGLPRVAKTLPSDAGGMGSIPNRGTKIPHAM